MSPAQLQLDKPTAEPRQVWNRHRSPAVALVAAATLREARELTAPELHAPELHAPDLRSDAQRVSADLDYLIELARERSWPV